MSRSCIIHPWCTHLKAGSAVYDIEIINEREPCYSIFFIGCKECYEKYNRKPLKKEVEWGGKSNCKDCYYFVACNEDDTPCEICSHNYHNHYTSKGGSGNE